MLPRILLGLLVLIAVLTVPESGIAAPTAEQKTQMRALVKEVAGISAMVRKKQFEEAEAKLEELNTKAEELIKEAGFAPNDRMVASLRKQLTLRRKSVAKALGKPDPTLLSFSKDVAPILQARCGNCHSGDDPRGRLDLSSFAGMRRGGANGPLLRPKNPRGSLIMARVTAVNDRQRMPRNGNPLAAADLQKIYTWIEQGAIFDGKDQSTLLSELGKDMPEGEPTPEPTVVINKATGNEKVSFIRDVAPTIVNLCTGCHGANNPRSGLSVVSFESLMRGGDSGRVIIAGNLDGSRLWRLVGAGDQPRMPQGQARITRKFHADLRTWIEEGAKFDGDDPKLALRRLVPTDEEKAMERLAALTPEEFRELREERTQAAWKRVSPRTPARFISTSEFLVYGDASEVRLKQVSDWAEKQAQELRSIFKISGRPIWKGRLAVFVMKDRFGYTEFNQVIHSRGTARDLHGHSHVTAGFEDAFAVVQDIGDDPSTSHGGLQLLVAEAVTSAWLRQPGRDLPEWVVRGTGLALAAKTVGQNSFMSSQKELALDALQGIEKPEDVFTDGRFGPGAVGPIGYTLVDFMIKAGGAPKFGSFIGRLQSGSNVAAAVKSVYPPTDLKALGTNYLQSFSKK